MIELLGLVIYALAVWSAASVLFTLALLALRGALAGEGRR